MSKKINSPKSITSVVVLSGSCFLNKLTHRILVRSNVYGGVMVDFIYDVLKALSDLIPQVDNTKSHIPLLDRTEEVLDGIEVR